MAGLSSPMLPTSFHPAPQEALGLGHMSGQMLKDPSLLDACSAPQITFPASVPAVVGSELVLVLLLGILFITIMKRHHFCIETIFFPPLLANEG